MDISASLVKELRERTGSGLMECKKTLVETHGDIDAAIELMRKSGLAKADKKAGRTAAEGIIALGLSDDGRHGAMVEVNCETDFVARGDDFIAFSNQILRRILQDQPADLDTLMEMPLARGDSRAINTVRQELVAKLGENINVRRFVACSSKDGIIGGYLHGTRIGVLVELQKDDTALAKDIAMHIAASKPVAITEQEVPTELLEKEKEIFTAQAAESGKPANIIEKMVSGRLRKYLAEITLQGQPFVKDPDTSVGKLLKDAGNTVRMFYRFEVGEGIERKDGNFAEEVMAQVRGG
jgi:elongation factor Ts